MNGHAIREAARAIAALEHDGICRKGAGEPYFNHVERVAANVWGWRRKALAYLHDVIEDSSGSNGRKQMEDTLRRIFYSDGRLVTDLLALTHGEYETYDAYIDKLIAWGVLDCLYVKLADLEDNLADLSDIPGMQHKQKTYLKAKARIELAIAEKESA